MIDVSYNTLWRAVRDNQFAAVRIRDRIVVPIRALNEVFNLAPARAAEDSRLALGLNDAATMVGVSYNTLWRAAAAEQFPCVRIRDRILVPRAAVCTLFDTAIARTELVDAAVWTSEWREAAASYEQAG